MAKFVLGGIITNIAGSVGGTTLRRVPNGFSMYNKSKGTSIARLLNNTRVPQIARIFQKWSGLTDVERAGWNATALTVTFPDKFGVAKNLTGRQLFSKANIQLLPIGIVVTDSTGFTNDQPIWTLSSMIMNGDDGIYSVNVDIGTDSTNLFFSVEISNKQIYQPTFKSRKVIQDASGDIGVLTVNLEGGINEFYPYIATGMWIAVYAQSFNSFGMLSPYQVLIAQVG